MPHCSSSLSWDQEHIKVGDYGWFLQGPRRFSGTELTRHCLQSSQSASPLYHSRPLRHSTQVSHRRKPFHPHPMALKLKPVDPALGAKLQTIESTISTLTHAPDRWKPLRALAKQQTSEAPPRPPLPSPDDPGPLWIKRMDTLFGSPDEPLRVIRCECGLQTREVNGRACVSHKVACELLKQARGTKRQSLLGSVESSTKKRASSEVSLDSSQPPPKKKKAMIIDHTTAPASLSSDLGNSLKMTSKQLKKALAQADRQKRDEERKEKKRREEELKKANQKKLGRVKGGPVNVDTQCGVFIPPPINAPCARSLTCKTHSMGAKRSVEGRSAPYDVLLNEWQKKHNPKWGDRKVVTPRVGPGIEPPVSKKKQKEAAMGARVTTGGTSATSGSGLKQGSKDKEKDATKTGIKSHGNHSKSYGGVHGGAGGGAYGTSKKKDGQYHRAEGGRPAGDKLTAANEAKLLGEIDDDFYFTSQPTKPKPLNEVDGLMSEQESGNHSDIEIELILKGIVASHPGQPLATVGMGSAWVNPKWSKFGKLGVKESFRDAFRGKV